MIKGKLKYPGMHKEGFFVNRVEHACAIHKIETEKAAAMKRLVIQGELKVLREQLKIAMEERKEYDIKMQHHTDLKTLDIQKQINNYESQINRLTVSVGLCKKALITKKKEITEGYRLDNPFSTAHLKKLQNKEYTLSLKLNRT